MAENTSKQKSFVLGPLHFSDNSDDKDNNDDKHNNDGKHNNEDKDNNDGKDNNADTDLNSNDCDDGVSDCWSCCSNAGSDITHYSDLYDISPSPDGVSDNDDRFSVASDYDDKVSYRRSDRELYKTNFTSNRKTFFCDALLYDCGCCWCERCNEKVKKNSEVKDCKTTCKGEVYAKCWNALDAFRNPHVAIWKYDSTLHRPSCRLRNYKTQSADCPSFSIRTKYRPFSMYDRYPVLSDSEYSDYSLPINFRHYSMDYVHFLMQTFFEKNMEQETRYFTNYTEISDESPEYDMETSYIHYDQPTDEPIVSMDPGYTPYDPRGDSPTSEMDSAFSTRMLPDETSPERLYSTYTKYDRKRSKVMLRFNSHYSIYSQFSDESPIYRNTFTQYGMCNSLDRNTSKTRKWQKERHYR